MKRDETFVAAIASGARITQASELAGFSRITGWRRLQDPKIQAAIAQSRDETFGAVVNALAAASHEAIETLRAALQDGPPQVRVKAAEALLNYGLRYRETADTEARIEVLEDRVERAR